MICPGPIRLYPAQNDQKGVRAHVVKFGSLLVWVFCRRPRSGPLIRGPMIGIAVAGHVLKWLLSSIAPSSHRMHRSGDRVVEPVSAYGAGHSPNGALADQIRNVQRRLRGHRADAHPNM